MQPKSKGSANDPEARQDRTISGESGNQRGRNATEIQVSCERSEHVNTEPCPEKGHGVPIPKRGAFPTPKAIIKSSPQYTPEASETTGGESVTEPVSSTNAKKSGINGAK